MVSPVDICNLALTSLGQPNIVQIDPPDEGSKAARLCAQLYPLLKDETLRSAPWRRLKKRAELAASVVAPEWGFSTQYPVPADMLRLLEVYIGDTKLRTWELEGDNILCNEETGPIQIRYIKTSDDPNEWDSLMVTSLAYRLAVDLAEPLTQDPAKIQFAIAKFREVMNTAKNASSQEGTPTDIGLPDNWISVRYGAGSFDAARGISEV